MARRKNSEPTSETKCEGTAPPAAAGGVPAIAAKPPAEMTLPERVEQTVRWLLTGSRDADVVDAIHAHWPDQELQPLIVAAMDELAKSAEFDPDVVRGWCFEATKQLYQQMVAIGDFAGALRAVKQLADLAGR